MLRKIVALVILVVAMLPSGCSLLSHEAPPEDIDKAAALFFQRLGNEEYDTIYNDVSKEFKQNKTRQIVTDSLKEITQHGKIVKFDRISMSFQGEGKSRMASPVYSTASEGARAEITLNFQDEGGEWKLFGFAYKPRI